jgi:hypothetical protein
VCPINTKDWCTYEYYWIRTGVSNWTNVSSGSKIKFGWESPS